MGWKILGPKFLCISVFYERETEYLHGYLKCYMCYSNLQVTGKGQGYIHQGQSSRSIIMVDVNYYWKCQSHLFLFNSMLD